MDGTVKAAPKKKKERKKERKRQRTKPVDDENCVHRKPRPLFF